MSFFQAILLGIIQGLTEFLPISSSAHLVLVPSLLHWDIPAEQRFIFDVLVQLGTLLAVTIYFWKDLYSILHGFILALSRRQPFADPQARLGWLLILATIPAGVIGILTKGLVEAAFGSPRVTAALLYGTAALLLIAERVGQRNRSLHQINWSDALWIGFAQAISIFPGISRSGATIAGGMTRHLERPAAARFSFLMSIPVMLIAGLLSFLDLLRISGLPAFLPVMVAGFITAAIVGYLSIRWLLAFLMSNSLGVFALYCVVVATAVLGWELAVPQPVSAKLLPTVTPWQVQISSSLDWLRPQMNLCIQRQDGFALLVDPLDPSNLSTSQLQTTSAPADFVLRWGPPPQLASQAVIVGWEEMAVIVNPQNTLPSLTLAELRAIYSGKLRSWKELNSPDSPVSGQIVAWAYPPGRDVQQIMTSILAAPPQPEILAGLAPDPLAMRQAVAGQAEALGYLPLRWLDGSVRRLALDGATADVLRQPVLAVFASPLSSAQHRWLTCLQEAFQP